MKLKINKHDSEFGDKRWININFENGDLTLTAWDIENDEFYIRYRSRIELEKNDPVFELIINKSELQNLLGDAFERLLSVKLD